MSKELPTGIYKDAFDLSPDAMIMVDKTGEIVGVNDQTDRIFGYEKDELIDQQVEVLVPDTVKPKHEKYRDGFFKNPFSRPLGGGIQLHGKHKDGHEFEVAISLSPIYLNGKHRVSAWPSFVRVLSGSR